MNRAVGAFRGRPTLRMAMVRLNALLLAVLRDDVGSLPNTKTAPVGEEVGYAVPENGRDTAWRAPLAERDGVMFPIRIVAAEGEMLQGHPH